ncbi:hypothetical protein EU527_12735 [Candidatus Thorarchaeota archaeon]|nr:MAG: hypothetical protein EU527_12735 [Candidatus Thorarchaeota archaeon]
MVKMWDRRLAEFVEVPVQRTLDNNLGCKECRYFDEKSQICQGIGSIFYQKKIPHTNFVPRKIECAVRLPPELLTFV